MRPHNPDAVKLRGIAAEANVPDDFDWYLWRLCLSDRIRDDRATIERDWTMGDVLEAHLALDVAEDLAIVARRRLRPTDPRAR